MASSSRSFSAEAVLALLDQQEEFDDAIGGDVDGESEDDDHPEGDFTDHDGTESLVQPEMLANSGLSLVAEAFDHPGRGRASSSAGRGRASSSVGRGRASSSVGRGRARG